MSTSPIRLEMLDFKEVLSSLPLQTLSPGAEAAFPGLPGAHGDRAIPKMSGNRKPWKMRGQLPPVCQGTYSSRPADKYDCSGNPQTRQSNSNGPDTGAFVPQRRIWAGALLKDIGGSFRAKNYVGLLK